MHNLGGSLLRLGLVVDGVGDGYLQFVALGVGARYDEQPGVDELARQFLVGRPGGHVGGEDLQWVVAGDEGCGAYLCLYVAVAVVPIGLVGGYGGGAADVKQALVVEVAQADALDGDLVATRAVGDGAGEEELRHAVVEEPVYGAVVRVCLFGVAAHGVGHVVVERAVGLVVGHVGVIVVCYERVACPPERVVLCAVGIVIASDHYWQQGHSGDVGGGSCGVGRLEDVVVSIGGVCAEGELVGAVQRPVLRWRVVPRLGVFGAVPCLPLHLLVPHEHVLRCRGGGEVCGLRVPAVNAEALLLQQVGCQLAVAYGPCAGRPASCRCASLSGKARRKADGRSLPSFLKLRLRLLLPRAATHKSYRSYKSYKSYKSHRSHKSHRSYNPLHYAFL